MRTTRALVVGVLLLIPLSVAAQQSAEINGRVLDPDGLALPGATVTVTNEGTGLSRNVVAGAGGTYVINLLPPGNYTILVAMDGFASLTRNGVTLAAGAQTTFDWRMQLAGVQETLTVTGESPLVERTSNVIGATLSEREMEEVPSNFRNFISLTALVPGITPSPTTSSFEGGTVSANGSQAKANTRSGPRKYGRVFQLAVRKSTRLSPRPAAAEARVRSPNRASSPTTISKSATPTPATSGIGSANVLRRKPPGVPSAKASSCEPM